MTCAHCSELLAEVTELRRQLALEVDHTKAETFCAALGITPQQAAIVAALYDAKDRPISKGAVLDLMPVSWGERTDDKIVDVQICMIRKVLGAGFIETVRMRGYSLSQVARANCDAALVMPDRRMAS